LFNSKEIQKEIEQLRKENKQVKEMLDEQHQKRLRDSFN